MFETSDSEINVDRVMHEIREDVARQHRGEGQKVSASLSGFSLTGKSRPDSPGDSFSLSLQPESYSRPDDQYHINDFLKYHGERFVHHAYRAILKREPDAAGLAQYLERLAGGRFNKVDILASLRYSPEGERAQVKVKGLAWPARIRRVERVPIAGYLLQMVIAVARLPNLLRHLRQSEFYLLAQQQQIVDHDNQVHQQLAEALAQISAQTLEGTERAANQQQVIESLLQQGQSLAAQQIEFRNNFETRLTDTRQHIDQQTAALAQQVREQAERLLERNQELKEIEGLLRRQQEQTQGLANEKDQLLARQHELTQEVAEQKDRFLRGQQELSLQMADQKDQLLRRHQLTYTELVMQERRLTLFLETVREHSSGPLDQPIRQLMTTEKDHLLDPLYASFEDQFRGGREEIKNRLGVYLPIFREAEVVADVLDIGCGRGEWLEILQQEGVGARGIDHNRVFIEQCRQNGLDVVEADALAYLRSLPDQSLNAVTSFHLIEHLPFEGLIALLDEMIRALRSGGLVILETPNPENFMVGSCNFYADPTHRNPIPSPTLKFLLESRGLVRLEVMKLRPWDAAKIEGDSEIVKRFNEYFYSAPDYGIVGRKA
jgi:O-antigen chain-terminating methyltransferase